VEPHLKRPKRKNKSAGLKSNQKKIIQRPRNWIDADNTSTTKTVSNSELDFDALLAHCER